MTTKIIKHFLTLGTCLAGLLTALLAFEAYRRYQLSLQGSQANHWGMEIRYLWGLSALLALSAVVTRLAAGTSRKVTGFALSTALLLAVVVFVVDRQNLLVHYETWLHRGMPRPGIPGPHSLTEIPR